MRRLLDTHDLLWFLADDPDLAPKAKAIIENLASPAGEPNVAVIQRSTGPRSPITS